jgi:hypothetical protein
VKCRIFSIHSCADLCERLGNKNGDTFHGL